MKGSKVEYNGMPIKDTKFEKEMARRRPDIQVLNAELEGTGLAVILTLQILTGERI